MMQTATLQQQLTTWAAKARKANARAIKAHLASEHLEALEERDEAIFQARRAKILLEF